MTVHRIPVCGVGWRWQRDFTHSHLASLASREAVGNPDRICLETLKTRMSETIVPEVGNKKAILQ